MTEARPRIDCAADLHDWVERGSGPEDRWHECFLCGVTTDVPPATALDLAVNTPTTPTTPNQTRERVTS